MRWRVVGVQVRFKIVDPAKDESKYSERVDYLHDRQT